MYKLIYSPRAQDDAKKISRSSLKEKCQNLLDIIEKNPYQKPPPYEKLLGDLRGRLSRRINIQHRLVYEVLEKQKIVKVLRMWSHYE
jgi:Txe/YoeB family toxin of toxin-antitoxin system